MLAYFAALTSPAPGDYLPVVMVIVVLLLLSMIPLLLRSKKQGGVLPIPQDDPRFFQEKLYDFSTRWDKAAEFFNSLANLPEPEKIYDMIPVYFAQIVDAKYAALFIRDHYDDDLYHIKAHSSLSVDTAEKLTLNTKQEYVRFMVQTGRFAHFTIKDRPMRALMKYPEQFNELLLFPLKTQGKITGILMVANKNNGHAFSRQEVETLNFLISPISFSLSSATQYDTIKMLVIGQIVALVNSLEKRDEYTKGHSDRVAKYSDIMAQQLYFSREDREILRNAALLHDLGKIGIRDDILLKPDRLTAEEFEIIKSHPQFGYDILKPLEFMLKKEMPIILHHHERWDGKGYPQGLKRDQIPAYSRIMAIADSYDAMTSNRPYRQVFTQEQALQEMQNNSGFQFDPELLNIFLKTLKKQKSDPKAKEAQEENL